MRTTSGERAELRRLLREAAPWLDEPDLGPRAVDAGLCDACGSTPRLLPTCGPAGVEAVCRDCADALGEDGWCDGHREQGVRARTWAAALPDAWPDVILAWWIATGELRTPPDTPPR
jgi:hypothetical protein